MRILIVNKFFYPRGGDCVVAMGTREMLINAGHQVRIFAMHHPENISLDESNTFATQIDFSGTISDKIKAFKRLIGIGDITDTFLKVLDDFKPEIVHVHNIHSYLSPVICSLAHDRGIPVVWTLHDFKLICPAYTFLKADDSICDFAETKQCNVLKHRCLKSSVTASLIAMLEARRWPLSKLDAMTDAYIAPSSFMSKMMRFGGSDPAKTHILYNFIDPIKLKLLSDTSTSRGDKPHYFAYTGRLSKEKGVKTMINAAIKAGVKLKIAGDGPIRHELEELAKGHDKIVFLGNLSAENVARLQREADACICPSEWFENNPLAVIESLCAGTPVIGTDIGGIPELITPGINGLLYKPGDTEALTTILKDFKPQNFNNNQIADASIAKFSQDAYLNRLLTIYESSMI